LPNPHHNKTEDIEMANIEIKKVEGIANCGSCLAVNFDSPIGKRTETVYSVRIGNMAFPLCEDCLKQLSEQLNAAVESF
jgi:hypothetical protein